MLGNIFSEFKYAFRMLRKSPGFALAAVAIMSIGIGASTLTFSVVNTVLVRGLPYKDAVRLVAVEGNFAALGISNMGARPAEFFAYREQNRVFEDTAAFSIGSYDLAGGDHPESIQAARISPTLLDLLGVQPSKGRAFSADDYKSPDIQTVIISDSLWSSRFGRAADVVGQTIRLSDKPYRIVGVMPPGVEFQYLRPGPRDRVDVWFPLVFTSTELHRHGGWFLRVIGRLKPGVSPAEARADLGTIGSNLTQSDPAPYRGPHGEDGGWKTTVFPVKDEVLGNVGTSLVVLLGAVGLVLLIACANLAGLILARGFPRRAEVAIRAALGASRFRIAAELLFEGLVLSIVGGVAGLVLASWSEKAIVGLGGSLIPRLKDLSIDSTVLVFALGLCVLTPLIFALAPSISLSGVSLIENLKAGARGTVRSQGRLYGVLVASELALTLVLLISAGLMIRSFVGLAKTASLGFDPSNVVTMNLSLPSARYDAARRGEFFQTLLAKLGTTSAIQQASLSTNAFRDPFSIEGKPFSTSNVTVAYHRLAGPGYFNCLKIPLVAGREFSPEDVPSQTPVAVINQSLASRFFSGQNPLGQHIKVGAPGSPAPWLTIVGIVGDVRDQGPAAPPEPEMYAEYLQTPTPSATLMARSTGPTATVVATIQDEIGAIDKNQPVFGVSTLEDSIASTISQPRFDTALLISFSLIALMLSASGIYGVVSYSVGQRTQEIGVRFALGANRRDVLSLVIKRGFAFAGAGMVAGLVGSVFAPRLLAGLLYGVKTVDPGVYAGFSAILVLVCVCACLIPALRASRIDPAEALRLE